MKKYILLLLLVLAVNVSADEINIPFSCWPLELQHEFGKKGLKLDLTAGERTDDSWGYIDSKGSSYSLFTYRSATIEDFEFIREVSAKIELEKRDK